MSISDSQIQSWSKQGGTQQSAETYKAISNAINDWTGWPTGVVKDVFLQGSYGNSTNIRGNSDVDIVVALTSAYEYNTSRLSSSDLVRWNNDRNPASYLYSNFRDDVFQAIEARFPNRTHWGSKCINVGGENQRLNADVVPAITYRDYIGYASAYQSHYHEGIKFRTTNAPYREIINYPRAHLTNGQNKNTLQRTNGNYKPLIRVFKNARDYLIDQKLLADNITPSYFVECLIYNVPDALFTNDFLTSFIRITLFLHDSVIKQNPQGFVCQNGIIQLFGPTPEQWNIEQARLYIRALVLGI